MIQTAESGLNEIRNMVLRIRELSVQMANGIYENTPDRANAQLEVAALLEQVDLIAENTRFNDVSPKYLVQKLKKMLKKQIYI